MSVSGTRRTESEERAALATEAMSWVGTPFHHGQLLKGLACDCLTLLVGVFANTGIIPVFPLPEYRPDEFLHQADERYADGIAVHFVPLGTVPPHPGDLVTFRFGRRAVAHAGIATDEVGTFVSATAEHGRVEVGFLHEAYWATRWTGTWRLKQWCACCG